MHCFVFFEKKKVQVGKDQEKAQSVKDSHSKIPRWEKTKLTIRYLYHETYRKPNEVCLNAHLAKNSGPSLSQAALALPQLSATFLT